MPFVDVAKAIKERCSLFIHGFDFKQFNYDQIRKLTKLKNISNIQLNNDPSS